MTTAIYNDSREHSSGSIFEPKRLFDLLISSLGLLCIWPVFLVISFAIALNSRGPVFFVQTRVGKNGRKFRMFKFRSILRRCSLDELPQLFNVLLGDMSLVGPRPALVDEVAAYPEHAHRRHKVLPGITGLWQVSGRADIGFDDMITLDLEYVRRVSVWTDLFILLRTVSAVFSGKGAY